MASLFFSQYPLLTEAASHKRKVHCSSTLESGDLYYIAVKISLVIVTSSPQCLAQISTKNIISLFLLYSSH